MSFFCPKIDGGWGFAPDPTGGAYSTPQTWLVLGGGTPRNGLGEKVDPKAAVDFGTKKLI